MPEGRALKDELLADDQQPEQQTNVLNPLQLELDETRQKEVVDIVTQDFESAVDAREQKEWGGDEDSGMTWDEKYGELMKLYEDKKAARPEKWMANRSLRIAMAITEMMFAKLYPAVWNEEMLKWKPVEYTDAQRTERISKFMKWVAMVQMKVRNVFKPAVKYTIKFGNVIIKNMWKLPMSDLKKI